MDKVVDTENIRNFAYVNDKVCTRPIAGVAVNFFGLGGADMYGVDTVKGEFFGSKGILYIVPYTNPWAWMNEPTVKFVDEIVDAAFEKFALADDTPVVYSGNSMGGQSALVYTANSKRKPVACVANCPVCDSVFHYSERDDLPRTMYSALCFMDGSIDDALKTISPLHLVDKMPKIEYHIIHCADDKEVDIKYHSDKFVAKMREKGHSIGYDVIPDRGHCDIGFFGKKKFAEYITDAITKNQRA